MEIKKHKIVGAPYVATKKHGGKIKNPKFIVLHFTAGWTSEGDIATLAKSNRVASAHGVLSREGKWTQIVPFDTVAWHAGPSKANGYVGLNNYSIGIEVSNIGYLEVKGPDMYVDEYGNRLHGDGKFYNGKRKAHSAPSGWPHYWNERLKKADYVWEPFYEKQLDALEGLVRAILKEYPSIEWIVTHEEIDLRKWKTDINGGRHFPMKRFLKLLERREPDETPEAPGNTTIVSADDDRRDNAVAAIVEGADVLVTPVLPGTSIDDADNTPTAPTLRPVPNGATNVQIVRGDPVRSLVIFPDGLMGWVPTIRLSYYNED